MKRGRRTKLLYLIDKMGAGGAQTHLRALVGSLDKTQYAVRVVCLVRGGVSAERLVSEQVPVEICGIGRLYGPKGLAHFLRMVSDMRHDPPDILHTYLTAANVFGAALARTVPVPVLVTSRRDDGFGDGQLMQRALRFSDRVANRVVAVSRDAASVALDRDNLDRSKLVVIPNGVDLKRFSAQGRRESMRRELGIEPGTTLLTTVGHLTPIKGIDLLIDAAAEIKRHHERVRFLVAGRGRQREELTQRIYSLGLGRTIQLLGSYDRIPELLEASDIFVLPSRSEGQPNAVIEAMAMGLPIVATDVGGVSEVCRDNQEAVVVSEPAPAAIAEGALRLLRSGHLRKRLGQAATKRAREEFSLTRMVARYETLYLSLVTSEEGAHACSA